MNDNENKNNFCLEPKVLAQMKNVYAPNAQINIQATLNFHFSGKSFIAFPNPANYSSLLSDSSKSNENTWKLTVPISLFATDISDFKTIAENKYRFIDKSLLIEKLISDEKPIKIVTRPSGFGKTFNLSMLQCFLSSQEKPLLFHQLKIAEKKEFCQQHQCQYPVIFITFKDIKADNYEHLIERFRIYLIKIFKDQIKQHNLKCQSELDLLERKECGEGTLQLALARLINYIHTRNGKPVILLLDDYDTPLCPALSHAFKEDEDQQFNKKILFFMKELLNKTLKSDECLKMVLLAGKLPLESKKLFSEIDNIYIDDVHSGNLSQYFGFTQTEISEQFNDAFSEITPEHLDNIEINCGGYCMGEELLFNPRFTTVIFDYCRYHGIENLNKIKANIFTYSGNKFKKIFDRFDEKLKSDFKQLLSNKPIVNSIVKETNLTFLEKNSDNLLNLLVHSGYLTVQSELKNSSMHLIIPNLQIYQFYEQELTTKGNYRFKNLNKTRSNTIQNSELKYYMKNLDTMSFYRDKLFSLYTFIMGGHTDISILDLFIQYCNNDEPWWKIAGEMSQIFSSLDKPSTKRIARSVSNLLPTLTQTNKNAAIRLLNKLKYSDEVIIAVIEKLRVLSLSEANSYIELLNKTNPGSLIITKIFTACLIDAELHFQKINLIVKKLEEWLLRDNHSALDILIHGLRSPQLYVQVSCIAAINQGTFLSGDVSERIVKELKRLLTTDQLILRIATIASLGRMINFQCVSAQILAEEMLSTATEFECIFWMDLMKEDEDKLGSWKGSDAMITHLKQYLEMNIPHYDNLAIKVFGKWAVNGNSEALHLLEQALNSLDVELQEKWVKALDIPFCGCSKVVPILASALAQKGNQPICLQIIKILTQWARHGTESALEAINQCLKTSIYQEICDKCIIGLEIGQTMPDIIKNLQQACSMETPGSLIHAAAVSRLAVHAQRTGEKEVLAILALALEIKNPLDVHRRCVADLESISTTDAIIEKALWICLQDPDFNLRQVTLNTLKKWAKKNNPIAITLIKKGLQLSYPEVLEECVDALKKINPDDDIVTQLGKLLELHQTDQSALVNTIVRTLTEWAKKNNNSALQILVDKMSASSAMIRGPCILSMAIIKNFDYLPNILRTLQDDNPEVVQSVRITLSVWAGSDHKESLQELCKGLEKPELTEKWLIALIKAPINEQISNLLEPYLNDPQIRIRNKVLDILENSSTNSIVALILIKGLISHYPDVWKYCYQKLKKVNNGLKADITRKLMEFLENKTLNYISPNIKEFIVDIIIYWAVNYGSNNTVYGSLESSIASPSLEKRRYWIEQLSHYNGTNNYEVIRLLGWRVLKEDNLDLLKILITTLTKFISSRDTSPPESTILLEGLHSSRPLVRKFCIESMRKLYDAHEISSKLIIGLKDCLHDSDSDVQAAAVWQLGCWSNRSAISEQALLALISGLKTGQESFHREFSLHDQAAKLLEKFLIADAKCVRGAAMHTLIEFVKSEESSKTALLIIQKNLSSPYEDVQIECACALKNICWNTTNIVESLQECLNSAKTIKLRSEVISSIFVWAEMGNATAMGKLKQGLLSEFRDDWMLIMKDEPVITISIIKVLTQYLNSQEAKSDSFMIEILMQCVSQGNRFAEDPLVKALSKQELFKQNEYLSLLKQKVQNSKPRIMASVERVEAKILKNIPSAQLSDRLVSAADNDLLEKKPNPFKKLKENTMKSTQTTNLRDIRQSQIQDGQTNFGAPNSQNTDKVPTLSTTSRSRRVHTLAGLTTVTQPVSTSRPIQDEGAILDGGEHRSRVAEGANVNVIAKDGSAIMKDTSVGKKAAINVISQQKNAVLKNYDAEENAKVRVLAGEWAVALLDKLEKKDNEASEDERDDIEKIKKIFDLDEKSKTERASIYSNNELTGYYAALRKINYHFGAAKSIQTGAIGQTDSMAGAAIKAGAELSKQIPIVGVCALILEKILSAKIGIDRHRAMQKLASWTTDSRMEDRLSERFARKMTLFRQDEILKPNSKEKSNKKLARAKEIVREACVKASFNAKEFKEGVSFSPAEQLALTDMSIVLDAIMEEEIKAVTGVSDDVQIADHLDKMLGIFYHPQPAPNITHSHRFLDEAKLKPPPVTTVTSSRTVAENTLSASKKGPFGRLVRMFKGTSKEKELVQASSLINNNSK